MFVVILSTPQIEHGSWSGQRVMRYHQINEHVPRIGEVEKKGHLFGHNGPAQRIATAFVLCGLQRENVRRGSQLLPFHRAVERSAAIRQNPIDAARLHALAGQPFAKPFLLVRRDLRDGFTLPILLPMGQAVPRGGGAGEALRMIEPVVQ
ncbi:MAG TPA: hypothetical protein VG387_18825 [Rhizomicrobium sp.]|nr:hypothetical protein [Rhizomicrobium sp.]